MRAMFKTTSWSVALVVLALLPGCKKEEGSVCYNRDECAEGLACTGEGVQRCEKCDTTPACNAEGKCTAKEGACVATSNDDCKKALICTEKGGCTAKDDACQVGSDEDCKQSLACKDERFCKAKANNCIRDPEAEKARDAAQAEKDKKEAEAAAGAGGSLEAGEGGKK
jgi:hypothetical protein